jgi:hypothetical protein
MPVRTMTCVGSSRRRPSSNPHPDITSRPPRQQVAARRRAEAAPVRKTATRSLFREPSHHAGKWVVVTTTRMRPRRSIGLGKSLHRGLSRARQQSLCFLYTLKCDCPRRGSGTLREGWPTMLLPLAAVCVRMMAQIPVPAEPDLSSSSQSTEACLQSRRSSQPPEVRLGDRAWERPRSLRRRQRALAGCTEILRAAGYVVVGSARQEATCDTRRVRRGHQATSTCREWTACSPAGCSGRTRRAGAPGDGQSDLTRRSRRSRRARSATSEARGQALPAVENARAPRRIARLKRLLTHPALTSSSGTTPASSRASSSARSLWIAISPS